MKCLIKCIDTYKHSYIQIGKLYIAEENDWTYTLVNGANATFPYDKELFIKIDSKLAKVLYG